MVALALPVTLGIAGITPAFSAEPEPAKPIISSNSAIEGEYIVHLQDEVDPSKFADEYDVEVIQLYEFAVKGFTGRIPEAKLQDIQRDPRIVSVEQNSVHMLERPDWETPPAEKSWALDRIDQAYLPLDGVYNHDRAHEGQGVNIFVVDTGVDDDAPDLEGRVTNAYNAVGGDWGDCFNHGTPIASMAAGDDNGVAKSANIHNVKITSGVDCSKGLYTEGNFLKGLDWVFKKISSSDYHARTVVNVSLRAESYISSVAAARLQGAGAMVVHSAGNEGADACSVSGMARYNPDVINVGSTNNKDLIAATSNRGPCVDLFAPGVYVRGQSATDFNESRHFGTSFASGYVSGMAAVLLQSFDGPTPEASHAKGMLLAYATTHGRVEGDLGGADNKLLHKPIYW
ncbi:S8 family serine peptidase [Streptomyces sp. NPDC057675]|uniref:S8 family serine peptidase n=1 Tax=Streptomyces sp. NPDC057675 TaxID=3346204 RepID=UPI003678CA07